MSWRGRVLIAGAFRGVPFLYEKVENEIGRRTITKEYPGRDQPHVEDLGRETRRFTMDMYVVGPDYDVDRDNLREAFETPGPGELDHPYWGTMQVTVEGKVRCVESTREGGMARFTATFVEAGAELALVEAQDTEAELVAAAAAVVEVSSTAFEEAFDIASAISDTVDAVVGTIQTATTTLNKIRGKINAALNVINDVKQSVDDLANTAESLLNAPAEIAAALHNVTGAVMNAITTISEAAEDLIDFLDGDEEAVAAYGSMIAASTRVSSALSAVAALKDGTDEIAADVADLGSTTTQQIIELSCKKALLQLTRSANIAAASALVAELEFESFDQASAMKDAVVGLVDDLIENDDELPDELYGPLTTLRAILVEHLNKAADTLPELVDYVPNATVPALVLAYQIYGDASREAELLLRNPQVKDPSALPGGQAVKVLSDA